jgi:hypothetical protein
MFTLKALIILNTLKPVNLKKSVKKFLILDEFSLRGVM